MVVWRWLRWRCYFVCGRGHRRDSSWARLMMLLAVTYDMCEKGDGTGLTQVSFGFVCTAGLPKELNVVATGCGLLDTPNGVSKKLVDVVLL